MMRAAIFIITLLCGSSVGAEEFQRADRPWDWEFPRDHGSHPEFQTEWWYFTGSLRDADGGLFGFELTFFRFAVSPDRPEGASEWRTRDLILAHFAVTDVAAGKFHLAEGLQRAAGGLAGAEEGQLHVFKGDWEVTTEGKTFVLRAGDPGEHRIELRLVPERAPVLHSENGLSWKSADRTHASYYYSIPRSTTSGEIMLGEEVIEVVGTTWMDHEFFTGDTPVEGVGWDWFSCRLDDGRDLMLYLLRYPDGSKYRSGTLVEADGSSRPLDTSEMTLEPGRTWTSPHTGATYPVTWSIELPAENLNLEVEAVLDEQEVHAEETVGFAYWEGLSDFAGSFGGDTITGEGYVELTGYLPDGSSNAP
jgi:predicted secreted hydrolase